MIIADLEGAIALLKERIDIVDVVGEVVALQGAGKDLKKGLCCFHEENTPSLTITPSKGLYHCFGCGASGDIVNFYKDYYHMSTVEAIYTLAEKYDVNIAEFEREPTPEERYKDRLQSIMEAIKKHASSLLPNSRGSEYLESRGISMATQEAFGLGYVRSLSDIFPLAQSVSRGLESQAEVLKALGVSPEFAGHWEDVVVYPLHDPRGKVIGFKNRPYHNGQIVDQQGHKLPKFVGTPSTSPLHDPGHIYGFHIARKHMTDGRLIIVEGQHDVLQAHNHGIQNVAGTDSTALNKEKIRTMEEYGVREIIIAYDGDNAGREASLKIATNAHEFETNIAIKIASLPDGKDPDEFIAENGKLEFLRIIHNAVYASQYVVDQIASTMPLMTVTNKIDFIKKCEPVMFHSRAFERTFIIDYVAEKIKISPDVIEDMLRNEQAKKSKALLYNLDGEKIVLGGMLRDEDFRLEALSYLTEQDWYLHRHRVVFEMIKEMDNNGVPITIDTLKTTMNNKQHKQTLNDGQVIDEIYATIGEYRELMEDVKDKANRRRLLQEADELKSKIQDLRNSTEYVSEEHLNKVEKIATGASNLNTIMTPHTGAKQFMATLHDRMQNPGKITGIDLGPHFQTLTGLINGFQKKKLITIAANQSVGKTTLTVNLLNHIAVTQKLPWAHFTLEMPNEEVILKLIGLRAGVNSQRIERGNVTDEEYARVRQATIEYHEGGLFLIDDCVTLESIINRTRTLLRNERIVGISIDYLQLMSLEKSSGKKKYEEEGEISGALKNDVAKKFDIPVVAISQMSRRALDRDIQKAEDGQGAYKIAQDSDIYMILQDKSKDEIEEYGIEYGNQILNLDKNRAGTADVLIDILFDKDTQRMMEVTQRGGTH